MKQNQFIVGKLHRKKVFSIKGKNFLSFIQVIFIFRLGQMRVRSVNMRMHEGDNG
jgi:hypothetical protein